MNLFVVFFHVVASIALIAIVLLQTGKGAEMGAAFGGASQTLFGSSGGSSFMSKLTTGAAVVFMITCLLLSYRPTTGSSRSIMKDTPVEQAQPQPAQPQLPEARPVQPETAPPAQQQAPAQAQPPAAASGQTGTADKGQPAAQPQQNAPDKAPAPAKKQ